MESPKSLFWYTRKVSGQWDLWFLCTLCIRFSYPIVPFSLSCKSRHLHLDDPWGTDPIVNPFYLEKKKKSTKGVRLRSKDCTNTFWWFPFFSSTPLWTFDDSPKIYCCLWSIMGKFKNSTFGCRNFRHPPCLTWWMTEKPSTLPLFKVSCKPTFHGSSYLGHDIAFFVKTLSALCSVQCSDFSENSDWSNCLMS